MIKFLFEYHMKMNGDTPFTLSRAIGIARQTMWRKLNELEGTFNLDEIRIIALRYKLLPKDVWDIFFETPSCKSAKIVERRSVNPSDARRKTVAQKKHDGRRHPVAKYRLPNGETWCGKGKLKNTFKAYLAENGLTRADLDRFLVGKFRKRGLQ